GGQLPGSGSRRREKKKYWSAKVGSTVRFLRPIGRVRGDQGGRGPDSRDTCTDSGPAPPRMPCTQAASRTACSGDSVLPTSSAMTIFVPDSLVSSRSTTKGWTTESYGSTESSSRGQWWCSGGRHPSSRARGCCPSLVSWYSFVLPKSWCCTAAPSRPGSTPVCVELFSVPCQIGGMVCGQYLRNSSLTALASASSGE